MRNYFPKRPSGALLHTLLNLYDVPFGFVTPPPLLRVCIDLFAVAEGWLLLYVGGSKSSETNPIPENWLVLSY